MYSGYYKYHLRGLGVVGVKFWASPLTFVVALTTLSHYRDGFSCVPRFHMFNTCHATACKCRIFVEHLSYAYTRALLIGGVSVCLPVCHIDSKLISVGSRSFFCLAHAWTIGYSMTILRVIDARGITITGLQTTLRLAKTGDIADFRPIGRKYAIFRRF